MSSIASADQSFKAFEISSGAGSPSYISFHTNPGSNSGVIVICSNAANGDWRVTNGTYVTLGSNDRIRVSWASGHAMIAKIGGGSLKIESSTTAPGLNNQVLSMRRVSLPLQVTSSMASAAHQRPVVMAPLMGSGEWVLQQKLSQDFLKVNHEIAMGWFD